jgi:hypothetical protein
MLIICRPIHIETTDGIFDHTVRGARRGVGCLDLRLSSTVELQTSWIDLPAWIQTVACATVTVCQLVNQARQHHLSLVFFSYAVGPRLVGPSLIVW